MSDFDLPETLDFTFVRRWECDNCGEIVNMKRLDCSCKEPLHDTYRTIIFKIQK